MHLRLCGFHRVDFHEARNQLILGTSSVLNCSEIERKRTEWGTIIQTYQ